MLWSNKTTDRIMVDISMDDWSVTDADSAIFRLSDDESPARVTWVERVKTAGPWNQQRTADDLKGALSLPMPVTIASPESLKPCFDHIAKNGTFQPLPESNLMHTLDEEPYYGTPYIEFKKGVVYSDRRVDLCKMVLGPQNIDALLDSLETNDFIEHFLLGNNIIGPAGCRRISKFLKAYPDKMKTWYLAGNCIDADGFALMVPGLVESPVENIWLKRNPLGLTSVLNLAYLIKNCKTLRTLDLDQTELGDEGVAYLFNELANKSERTSLQHIYMNAVGIGPKAAASLNRFLLSPACNLQSLYLSNNPLGDEGISNLTRNLIQNNSLHRLMVSSIGMTTPGAISLFTNLTGHSSLRVLDASQSFATDDLKAHYNYIGDEASDPIMYFIYKTPELRLLDISYSALSYASIYNILLHGVFRSASLCRFSASTIKELGPARAKAPESEKQEQFARAAIKKLASRVKRRLTTNIEEAYPGMSVEEFERGEIRWLKGPKEDLRRIDSVYRNRDAGLARRGEKWLDKWWAEDDTTLQEVMAS